MPLQVLLSAVQHLQRGGVARAFAAWATRVQASQQTRAMVQAAVGRWAATAVAAAFRQWRAWTTERAHHLQLVAGVLAEHCCTPFTIETAYDGPAAV